MQDNDIHALFIKSASISQEELGDFYKTDNVPIYLQSYITNAHPILCQDWKTHLSCASIIPNYQGSLHHLVIDGCDCEWHHPCAQPKTDEDWELLDNRLKEWHAQLDRLFMHFGYPILTTIREMSDLEKVDFVNNWDPFVQKFSPVLHALSFENRLTFFTLLLGANPQFRYLEALTTRPCPDVSQAGYWFDLYSYKIRNNKPIRALKTNSTYTPSYNASLVNNNTVTALTDNDWAPPKLS